MKKKEQKIQFGQNLINTALHNLIIRLTKLPYMMVEWILLVR